MNFDNKHITATECNEITPIEFDGRNIRIVDQDGEFWFVAADVAAELGYRDAHNLIRTLDDDEKDTHSVSTLGGAQEITLVSEPGLYRAIIQRRAVKKMDERLKARISKFQRWTFHDVLPSIRKTGSYGAQPTPEPAFEIPSTLAGALRLAANQAEQIETMRVDVEAHERLVKADGSLCFRDAAKALQARPIDLTRFFAQNGWTYRQGQNGPWLAYRSKIASGHLEHKVTTVDRSDGSEKVVTQCRVTPKGLSKLAKLLPPLITEVQ